ncbi:MULTISPECIES: transporter substrate-binding domain-containing protein [unclassified Ruminococcus]|uniref:ABC transporter substrate-binding protein n=1 Tax=unclassified Ruminococcus TaxID=2608920 RepID=UPI00319E5467
MKTKKLFKTILSGLTVVCMAASVPVYASDSEASDSAATEDLKAKYSDLEGKTLKVGTGCAQSGWSMDDGTGNPEGMDVDVLTYICDYYGINVEWTVSEYASLWGMVQNGIIDTIANLTTVNDDRLGLYWFTNTYAWESYSIVSRKADGVPEDGDMTFWKDKTIAGEAGSNATLVLEDVIAEQAEQGNTITELTLDSAASLIPAVLQNQADAEFQCTSTCAYAVAQSGNADQLTIQNVNYKNMPIVYGWARKEENKEYISAFNDLIDQMHEDGTLTEMSQKWFDMDVTALPEGEVNYVTTTGDDAWQSYEE